MLKILDYYQHEIEWEYIPDTGLGPGDSIFSRNKPAWIDKMELLLQNAVKQNGNIYVYFT